MQIWLCIFYTLIFFEDFDANVFPSTFDFFDDSNHGAIVTFDFVDHSSCEFVCF
jgi:hypothetical protein